MAKRLFALTVAAPWCRRQRGSLRSLALKPASFAQWALPNPPLFDSQIRSTTANSTALLTRRRFGHGCASATCRSCSSWGKLTPRKGVDHLVKAFAQLDAPGALLVIAGNDMGTRRAVEALALKLRLRERLIFTGLLSAQARLDALAAATVVVYPSRDEIFGLVPLEAILCGTPVVVCNDSGCSEVIAITGGGQAVPYGDVGRLAEAITTVLANDAVWRERARSGATIARQQFGSDVICDQLELLYAAVVAENSVSRRIGA